MLKLFMSLKSPKGGEKMAESIWDKIKKGLQVGAEKTKEFAQIANLKKDILFLETKKSGKFKELGEKIYTLFREGKKGDEILEFVNSVLEEIKEIEEEIKAKNEEIEKIRKEAQIKEEEVKKVEEEVKKTEKEEKEE